jgi:hypothetical protein
MKFIKSLDWMKFVQILGLDKFGGKGLYTVGLIYIQ